MILFQKVKSLYMSLNLSEQLLEQAHARGISVAELERQIILFKKGIRPINLKKPCKVNDGIIQLTENACETYLDIFKKLSPNLSILKFVPASGAATRMFSQLLILLNNYEAIDQDILALNKPECKFGKYFIENIRSFAFWNHLKAALSANNYEAEVLLENKNYRPLLEYTLSEKGLNYANTPKALIPFHYYPQGSRTALEEHFFEGIDYAKGNQGKINLHFTISPEHEEAISKEISEIKKKLNEENIDVSVELSFQDPSTDTLAVNLDNSPFVDNKGCYLFRPSGHGALLKNLNTMNVDIIYIKNIDNVVPDYLKRENGKWKKILCGYMLGMRAKINDALFKLEANIPEIESIIKFSVNELKVVTENELNISESGRRKLLFDRLNRPIRVCGMVKNLGEPGGGPFWVNHGNGRSSLQIVEISQIDLTDENQENIVKSATHFNPVDLVCSVKDFKGNKFDLELYSNVNTAFISEKSSNGHKLKALERPGLWNGTMEDWITFFVEVPIETFNPVKTVNDLLRAQHQPKNRSHT